MFVIFGKRVDQGIQVQAEISEAGLRGDFCPEQPEDKPDKERARGTDGE